MKPRARRIVFAVALPALVIALGQPARAAEPPVAPTTPSAGPSPAVKAEARERFDTGLHLFEKGENAGAMAEFKRAYQLIPNPIVLYNMGLVYAAMNRPVDALDALTQFLADAGPGTTPAEQKHATDVRAEQEKRIAQLVILTDHPATIEVDGVEVGHTPLAKPLRVGSGSHVVAVEAPGFLGSRREVTLAGQLTETIAMAMQPMDTRMAQLVVTSPMPGAEVVINGKRVGATPLPASVAVPPGKASVELQRAGYRTATQTIALDEGAHGELTFTLEEDPAAPASVKGRLVVTTNEPGSDLIVDGGSARPLAGAVSLPVGPHHVRVEKVGFRTAERNVEVVNGQDASLALTMSPTDETQARLDASRSTRKVVAWSVLGGGVALAIAGGVLAVVENGALSTARSDFTTNVTAHEDTAGDRCDKNQTPSMFEAHKCNQVHSYYQGRIDSAQSLRLVGILVGAGGLVTAGVGAVLLGTSGSSREGTAVATARGVTGVSAWTLDSGGGVVLSGRF